MLVGRAAECARIDRLLDSARQGRSGALVVVGEPGIGKTALLEHAVARAADMRVLATHGTKAEAELPFAGLLSVLRPVVDRIDALPAPQAAKLRGALALGPPATGDRFAVYAATLALLAEAADDKPVLIAVDDAHLLDLPSAEALVFAARRLDAEGVAILAVAPLERRDGFEPPTFEELPLRGLASHEAATLVAAAAARAPPPDVAARLVEATAGNPLGLLALASLLTEGQLAGWEAIEEPAPAGASVERAFSRQIETLGADARRALLVAAAGEASELGAILRAAATLGVGVGAFEELEAAGLVAMDEPWLRFRHPLVRSVAYGAATPPERRAAHRALAEALREDRNADLRARHLAAAALGPDEEAAAALERAASGARSRAGYATAASALESAALLSSDEPARVRRLLACADVALRAGRVEQAVRALDAASASTREPAITAAIDHARGRIALFGGRMRAASALLEAAARPVERRDPGRASTMLADAALTAYLAGQVGRARDLALEAQALMPTPGGNAGLVAELVLGATLFLAGRVHEGFRLLVSAADIADDDRGSRPDLEYVVFAAMLLVVAGEYRRAEPLARRAVEEARQAGALGILPFALYAASHLDLRMGRLTAAYASASEAVRLAADANAPLWRFFALGCLALVEAFRGDEAACRAHVGETQEAGARLELEYPRDADDALGILELACGRPDKAIPHLERANRFAEDVGGPPVLARFSAPDLVEAYVRAGHPVPEAMVRELERQSEHVEFAATAALAWRCRGLLAGEAEFDAAFAEALRLHETAGAALARARTALLYGERLRRLGRRVDARAQLRAALATFERLGAAAWARRAEAELRASGETLQRRNPTAAERLTPQELQIALVVARGATNREAGAALFLSPKTVEVHLGRVYRKLGIRSRTELAVLVAGDEAAVLQPA
jgi:DNA-binding CsgD family transcriptional regulator